LYICLLLFVCTEQLILNLHNRLKNFFLIVFFLCCYFNFSQEKKEIRVIRSDFVDMDQDEFPDATLFVGNVEVEHSGAIMFCNKAYLFQKTNKIQAYGNVHIVQGDTLFLDSKYAEYDGNTQIAESSGDVILRDPQMTLRTDKIYFDRTTQQAYYNTNGVITNAENILESKSGTYFPEEKMFRFREKVVLTNPEYIIKTNHLDYNTFSEEAFLFGASTIESETSFIYTEKGRYNSKTNLATLTKNSHIIYDNRKIEGDSIYYDRNREFASATNNIKLTDTINKTLATGNYGEIYRLQDSLILTKKALIATESEDKDTLYMSAQKIIITGKPNQRIVRAFRDARFYKTDMSGKADSIHSNENSGITQLIGNPVLWNGQSQMSGNLIHLLADKTTQKLDSIKVYDNVFIIEKDTLGNGFNQVKGQNLFGRFQDGKLAEVDIIKNTEMIYYIYSDNELYGIEKNKSSKINLTFTDNQIEDITLYTSVNADTFPEEEFPQNARKFRGFIWRGDERILSKDDVIVSE